MTVTLFLLGARLRRVRRRVHRRGVSAVPVLAIAGGLAALNLFASDKLALAAMGARVVTPQEAPQLHAMIDRLCVQADLPKPKVAVANTRMPNAFALGRSPKKATVCATTGIMELLIPGRARGRHGARAHARRQPRRGGDDAGRLLRHARRLHRPVRLPVRRRRLVRRRRRQPELPRAAARLARGLRRLVPADAGAVALPRVRGRPRRGDHHRPPERARLGAAEDLRRHAPDPAEGPARGRRAAGVLHLPRREGQGRRPVRHAPADGEADRGAAAARDAAPGQHQPSGLPRRPARQARAQAARA